MKLHSWAVGAALGLCAASATQAALFDRGGGMIYDSTLNITWLQDWNYAATSGYAAANAGGSGANLILSNGQMGWAAANTWANNLVYGGYSDWALPTIADTGTPGCNFGYNGTDCGYHVYGYGTGSPGAGSLSPLAYMYYVELGNKGYCDPSGNCPQSGWGLTNTGPFLNLQSDAYWSGTEYAPAAGGAWFFNTGVGGQHYVDQFNAFYAVAVRPGDVAAGVSEPGAVALTLLGFSALGVARRRRPH